MFTNRKVSVKGQLTARLLVAASLLTAPYAVQAKDSDSWNLMNQGLPVPQLSKFTIHKILNTAPPFAAAKEVLSTASGTNNAVPPDTAETGSTGKLAVAAPEITGYESRPLPVPVQSPNQEPSQPNVGFIPGHILKTPFEGAGPIIIDNDEEVETEATIKFEELPTDEGKSLVKTGARFPVVITSEITSKTAKKGDPVQARLKYDLKIGDKLIAKKGSVVTGHLNYTLKARSTMHSLVSPERWYRNSGALGIAFDEIINEQGEHLPLVAKPAQKALIVKNKGEGRVLGVNHTGIVTGPWSQQLRYKAVRIGLNAALAPAGVFSFGAAPVALGLIGAANPSFAFMKPVGLNVRHRRLKGFAWGFLSGFPGSWIIEDTVVRGQEAVIKPGDEFLAEFKEEFNGEPASDAMLMPGATTKVHGQIETPKHK